MFEELEDQSDSSTDGSEHEGSQESLASSLDEWSGKVREIIPGGRGGGSIDDQSRKRVRPPCVAFDRGPRARGVGYDDEPDVGGMDHQDVEHAATHMPQGLTPGQRLEAALDSIDPSPNVARFQNRPLVEASIEEVELETDLQFHRSSVDGELEDSFGKEIPIVTSRWQIHNEKLHKQWLELRPALSAASVRVEAVPIAGSLCSKCGRAEAHIQCQDCILGLGVGQSCKPLLCAKCDIDVHPFAHFHRRRGWQYHHWLNLPSYAAYDHAMLTQQSHVQKDPDSMFCEQVRPLHTLRALCDIITRAVVMVCLPVISLKSLTNSI